MNRAEKRKLKRKCAEAPSTIEKLLVLWNTAPTEQDAKMALGDFIILSMNTLYLNKSNLMHTLGILIDQSRLFCNKVFYTQEDPHIEWYLTEDWFATVVASMMNVRHRLGPEMEFIFGRLGFDTKKLLNPVYCSRSTIEAIDISSLIPEAKDVNILCVTKGDCPPGSEWKAKSSTVWTIVGNKRGMCEMVSEGGRTMYKTEKEIMKNFTKLLESC